MLNQRPAFNAYEGIRLMLPVVQSMVHDAILSFVNQDVALALEVVRRDALVDDHHRESKREIEGAIKATPSGAGAGIHLITISKALERAADRAASIAEEVVFLINARDIRHSDV